MNYKVKAYKIVSINDRTSLEFYEKDVPNYVEALKEQNRLKSIGGYANITIRKNKKVPTL